MITTCKSCGAEIIWAKTSAGKAMPVNAEPNPEGNVVLLRCIGMEPLALVTGTRFMAAAVAQEDGEIATVHTSHFATCPDAAKFRKKP